MVRGVKSVVNAAPLYRNVMQVLSQAGVPEDTRWRSLIFYFREMKEYNHLSDAQKAKIQSLLADTLSKKNFSDQQLAYILEEYKKIILLPFQKKIDEMNREASAIISNFQELLSARYGNISDLEGITISAVQEELPEGDLVGRLRGAFNEVKEILQKDMTSLESLANKDALTDIANRRAFDVFMENAMASWQKNEKPWGVAMIDIDFFKKFNDTHGHLVGDQVLKLVAKQLDKHAQSLSQKGGTALACRYGGEEFAIVASGSAVENLAKVTETARDAIGTFNFLIRNSNGDVIQNGLNVTISAGVAYCQKAWQGAHVENLMESADKALYKAKEKGRNRCVIIHPNDSKITYENATTGERFVEA